MEKETKPIGGKLFSRGKREESWPGQGGGAEGLSPPTTGGKTVSAQGPAHILPHCAEGRQALGLPLLLAPQLRAAWGSKGRASAHWAEDRLLAPTGRGQRLFPRCLSGKIALLTYFRSP